MTLCGLPHCQVMVFPRGIDIQLLLFDVKKSSPCIGSFLMQQPQYTALTTALIIALKADLCAALIAAPIAALIADLIADLITPE